MSVISFEAYKLKKFGASAPRPIPSSSMSARRERLLKATRTLRQSALKQNERAKKFLAVTSVLKEEMKKLEQSCVRLDGGVKRIRIKRLGRSAKKLAGTMDSVLSTKRL